MNTNQIRDSIKIEWPVDARFLLEKSTAETDRCMFSLRNYWFDLDIFERQPWWKKIGRRKKVMSTLTEGLNQILSEQTGNEKETEN